jgi:Arylsulfotransferase (ASST)/Fibronectin type III domain
VGASIGSCLPLEGGIVVSWSGRNAARVAWRTLAAAVVAVAAAVFAAGAAGSVDTVQISTSPGLYPAFSPAISDYVVRCSPATPVAVSVSNSDSSDTTTTVSVDGQPAKAGMFTAKVSVGYSQSFAIALTQGTTAQQYFVRCLPSGFPTWSSQHVGATQSQYYLVAPSLGTSASRWAIIYDTDGVPLWWMAPSTASVLPLDVKLVENGGRPDVLWTDMQSGSINVGTGAEEHSLDGSFAQTIHIASPYTLNPHEVQRLANGDYLVIGGYNRSGVNLSSIGGPASATILDDVVEEVTPAGTAVWTWDAYDHVGIDEVDSPWWKTAVSGSGAHDVYHINSAVTDSGGNLLVSLRYTDAVFFVADPAGASNPGRVMWKLGGTSNQKDGGTVLAISDPSCSGSCLGGQHYARFVDLGDGHLYVSLHDNGTNRGRPPRAVLYAVDPAAGTATRVEQLTDSSITASSCCGSAERLSGSGDWVVAWGSNPMVAEYASGSPVFTLAFSGAYSYRADAIAPGVLTREQLRGAMDTLYPRSSQTDTKPPSAPRKLAATANGATAINLSWTPSSDNVGVTGYRIERCKGKGCSNFVAVGTSPGPSFGDAGLSARTLYRYRVRAADAAGNLSSYSNIAKATTSR